MMIEPDDEVSRAFRVVGEVQGVGFRWWTRRQAVSLGLRGTVRNCPDGTVEVQAAGPAEALERFRDLLVAGPPAAIVARIDDLPPPRHPLPKDFRILT